MEGEAVYNGASYGGRDAETLWDNLVRLHPNVSLFLSGHQFEDFDQFKYHLDNGVHDNRVYELLVDPQNMANGGNGWIRLLEFDPDGTTVHVKTYSPFLNQWDTSPDNYYDINLSPIVPGDFSNNSVVDAADYVAWRKGLGTIYTQNDYNVWRAHFGQTAGNGVALISREPTFPTIPETATFVLSIFAGAGIHVLRRRRVV